MDINTALLSESSPPPRPGFIREAVLTDCADIARMQVESFRIAYADLMPPETLAAFTYDEQEQDWRTWMENNPDLLLVVDQGSGPLAGYALTRKLEPNTAPYDCELLALHIQRWAVRRGYGRALLAESARRMHAQGCRSLGLWMVEGNEAGAFYTRLGGRQQGEQELVIQELNLRRREVGFVWDRIEDLF